MEYPILMADVVNSRTKEALTLHHQLKNLVNQVNSDTSQLLSPLTITLGDEFQGVTKSVSDAIKIILHLEELIIHARSDLKLRYVVHVGLIDTPINPKIAYEMLGKGLTDARQILNNLKGDKNRFVIRLNPDSKDTEQVLNNLLCVYQDYTDSWKLKDYPLISAFLNYNDYKVVAAKLDIDTSTAWRRQRSLKISGYAALKNIIFALLKQQENDI